MLSVLICNSKGVTPIFLPGWGGRLCCFNSGKDKNECEHVCQRLLEGMIAVASPAVFS